MKLREQLYHFLQQHHLPLSLLDSLEGIVQQATSTKAPSPLSEWDDDDETIAGVTLTPVSPDGVTAFEMPKVPTQDKLSPYKAQHQNNLGLQDLPTAPAEIAVPPTTPVQNTFDEDSLHSLPPLEISEFEYKRRFQDGKTLGVGGMGEVRRVLDRRLNRYVAMKLLKKVHLDDPGALSRFMEEAHITARLEHPNIVPVHDYGIRHDKRPFFTMKEVHGRTLDELIRAVHDVSTETGWGTTEDGWNLRRLMAAFKLVCEAVGYAHSERYIHRDLKPDNIIVGDHGQVLVVDWGLSKQLPPSPGADGEDTRLSIGTKSKRLHQTTPGQIVGTPGYMSPEQLTQPDQVDERSDVYALGTILYEILAGRPAYVGYATQEIIYQMLSGPPQAPGQATQQMAAIPDSFSETPQAPPPESTRLLPTRLMQICAQAMARSPNERYPSAERMAMDIGEWLDGSEQRRQALKKVERARVLQQESRELAELSAQRKIEAEDLKPRINEWDGEDKKTALWDKEDTATNLQEQSVLMMNLALQALQEALLHDPELEEAHLALALHHKEMLDQAESHGDKTNAQIHAHYLKLHINALPPSHEAYDSLNSYLAGNGTITLHTQPADAIVQLYRQETKRRRTHLVLAKELGRTPLQNAPVEQGKYILKIQKQGHKPLLFPLEIQRNQHHNSHPPGLQAPTMLQLPEGGSIGPTDIVVPQGWCWVGDKEGTEDALPARRVWIEAFVIQQFSVTHREYIEFLNALVGLGLEQKALRYVPQNRSKDLSSADPLLYGRAPDGTFVLRTDLPPYDWKPNHPVVMIDWVSAMAYSTWMQKKTGLAWRLPWEIEWEKAARGVDGRAYPWGNTFETCWCNTQNSHPAGQARLSTIREYPVDQSPYLVRGMAGNVSNWCLDEWHTWSQSLHQDTFRPPSQPNKSREPKVYRGGSWLLPAKDARVAKRRSVDPAVRLPGLGFRLVRPYH